MAVVDSEGAGAVLPPKHRPVDVSEQIRTAARPAPGRITRPTSGVPVEDAVVARNESRPRE